MPRWRDRHGFPHLRGAGMNRAGRHHAHAMQHEGAVDRHAKSAGGRRGHVRLSGCRQMPVQRRDALAAAHRSPDQPRYRDAGRGEQGADFTLHLVAATRRHQVDLGDRHRRRGNPEQAENIDVLHSLRHHAVVGRHHD